MAKTSIIILSMVRSHELIGISSIELGSDLHKTKLNIQPIKTMVKLNAY